MNPLGRQHPDKPHLFHPDLDKDQRLFPLDVVTLATQFNNSLSIINNLQVQESIQDAGKAIKLIDEIQQDVRIQYQEKFGTAFDRFKLGDNFETAREMFLQHKKFDAILDLLKIDKELKDNIRLPWWSETSLVELGYRIHGSVIGAYLRPAHSYHVQLLRAGINPHNISPVSVSGLLVTPGTKKEPNGHLVLGLRGGSSFPNTYHLIAGAAKFEPNLTSLQEIFEQTELYEEVGLHEGTYAITPVARFVDSGLAKPPGDIHYFFEVKTSLLPHELEKTWNANNHPDKTEHNGLVFIPHTTEAIENFIRKNYKGISVNDRKRTPENAELLHPAALALIAYAGLDLKILKEKIS
jgi:hypothetical protein